MTPQPRRYLSSHLLAARPRVATATETALNWPEMRRWALSFGFLLVAVASLLIESSVATTSELEIAQLAKERELIRNQNLQIAAELAEFDKPSYIRSRAFALGLVEISKSVQLAVATAPPDEPLARPALSSNGTLLERWFDDWMRILSSSTP